MNDKILYVLNIDKISDACIELRNYARDKTPFKIVRFLENVNNEVEIKPLIENDGRRTVYNWIVRSITLTKAPLEVTIAARLKGLI